MRPILHSAAFLLVASSANAATPSSIQDNELALAGISLGATESSVTSSLGSPKNRIDTGEGTQLTYRGLSVMVGWLEQQDPGKERRVYELLSTSSQYCTPAGICPGTSFAKAKAKYGEPSVAKRESGTFMEYASSQSSCWLQFAVRKGIIKSVRAVCQP